jgi:hypothetical protein
VLARTSSNLAGTSGLGLDAKLTNLLCTNIIVAKSKGVKTGCNLAEYSKEACGSKKAGGGGDNHDLIYLNWLRLNCI